MHKLLAQRKLENSGKISPDNTGRSTFSRGCNEIRQDLTTKTEKSERLLVNKGLNRAEKEQGMSMAYRDRVRPGPPTVNITAQRVLRSSPVLAMLFRFSTLGTVCCSSGKSVKLTRLRGFGQIMRPVSSLEIPF